MDRLDALRIKYARAQEHRAAWDGALDKWVATMPYGVRGEADPTGWFVTRLRGSHGQTGSSSDLHAPPPSDGGGAADGASHRD
jgi:hypothetical protein